MSGAAGAVYSSVAILPMYWQILIDRVSDMSLFDSRHDTQRHTNEVGMSCHVTGYDVTSHHIKYRYTLDVDAAASDTQPLTSLICQQEISQDIT